MAPIRARLAARPRWVATLYAGNARAVIGRGFKVIRNANWGVIATGFFEPVFYLLAMGRGRPRTHDELAALLAEAGFADVRSVPTHLPLNTGVLTARAV